MTEVRPREVDRAARAVVAEAESLPLLAEILPDLPGLKTVFVVGDPGSWGGAAELVPFWPALQQARPWPACAQTRPDDPAFIVYTSGTTGNPKGALHAHRYLIGHLPGFELSHDFTPVEGDCYWTPADWAWVGGLTDILLAAWHYGMPVVGYRGQGGFSPQKAYQLMGKYRVRNTLIPPTALKMMRQDSGLARRYGVNLRTLASGGEPLGAETLKWAERELGVRINEIYGQTEINYFIGNCQPLWPARPGSMGRPYPGHRVAVVDDGGRPLPPGQIGEVAALRGDDPVFFLEYWNNPQGTREKFIGDWALTGDLAVEDEEGYFWFKGRKDDVIISAGHRIGPTEIEEALLKHPGVALSAVVGSPDPLRGQVVKAFIKLAPGYAPSTLLAEELQQFVKENLARHEYPREIEFLEDFPLTTTGKIRRKELRLLELERKSPETP
ncbi:MAG: AMP-binding protein [bacterium]